MAFGAGILEVVLDVNFLSIAIVLVVLVISVSIHEMMHAYMGYWLGDDTAKLEGRITLNPIKHIDPFMTILMPLLTLIAFGFPFLAAKPVPFNPARVKFDEFGAALVGVIGPISNILLAAVGAGLYWLLGSPARGTLIGSALIMFVLINIVLFVFNMMPIPPLDGSRLFYAFAPEPIQNIMASLEQFGIFIILAVILLVPAFFDIIRSITENIFFFLMPSVSGLF